MTGGIVRDIRTGRAVGRTRSLTETFVKQTQFLIEEGIQFYMVTGRCRMIEQREMIDFLRSLGGFPVIFDPQMPSDTVFIFEGEPSELGFAS